MEYYSVIKKEQIIDTYDNMDESKMYYAEWKKQVSKDYILYDSISMTNKCNVY